MFICLLLTCRLLNVSVNHEGKVHKTLRDDSVDCQELKAANTYR